MNIRNTITLVLPCLLTVGAALPTVTFGQGVTQDVTPNEQTAKLVFQERAPYSPNAGRSFPSRPLFGDTHVHTSYSMDAGMMGARLTARDAYRFAKGAEITSNTGQPVRLARPLDFLVVADHSDGFGFFPLLVSGAPDIMADPQGRRWNDMIHSGRGMEATLEIVRALSTGQIPRSIFPMPGMTSFRSAWEETISAADDANDPGRFTAFIGYEWTSNVAGSNLHRNVLFREDATKASQVEPYTTLPPLGSPNPRDLWKWMAAYEEKTGGHVLAIAHNGNLSNGRMFPIIESFTGKPIDREYAENRMRWEPLYEATQMKGDSEAHPLLSPNDEFADFETWDVGNLDLTEVKKPEMLEFEYARSALKNGLKLAPKLGTNPYKFGLIGSTDTHTALSTADDDNYFGKVAASEPSAQRSEHPFFTSPDKSLIIMGWEVIASGYAAVWATDNTRAAIFAAMERRETYATTGPRMVVRFFGGWEYTADDANTRRPAVAGYTRGVPMGGDLGPRPSGKSPTFLVAALKDPIGANLDRIQVIKGWVDKDGELQERVYDVAVSGGRRIDGNGRATTPVGNTIDVANATWTNSIGATEMITVWEDPDFDPSHAAFYYARVIEIPTPRWTAYDAKYYGIDMPEDVRMTTQERAYTSPIWYQPDR